MSGTLPQFDEGKPGYRFAKAVSYLINPLILPPIEFGLVLWHFGGGREDIVAGVGVGLVFFFLVPLTFVAWMVKGGRAATLEIRMRSARTLPFIVGIASYMFGMAVLWFSLDTARPLIFILAALYPINTALIIPINLLWKISVHATSIAGLFAALLFVAATSWDASTLGVLTVPSVLPWLVLVPLVMWARVRSGAHTNWQVVGGALFGFGLTLVELYFASSTFL